MQVRAEQLEQHLSSQPLQPCYLVFGDDPFLRQQQLDLIRDVAKRQGYDERVQFTQDKEFQWQDFLNEGSMQSLFSSKQIIELYLPESAPGREGGEVLRQFVSQQSPDQLLIVSGKHVTKTTQNTKWFKALQQAGVFVPVFAPDKGRLPRYITQRAQHHQVRLSQDACLLLAQWYEGNLLALDQELMKLALQAPERTEPWLAEELVAASSDQSRYDIFTLRDALLEGSLQRYLHCLERLTETGEEPVLILWTLAKTQQVLDQLARCLAGGMSTRELFQRERIWQQQQSAYEALARRYTPALNHQLVSLIERAELAIKRQTPDNVMVLFAHYGVALLRSEHANKLMPYAHSTAYYDFD
ncbi:DNA polymerase III subunit delta [Aliidiomarina taiwanensis]|uniref:DNA polymerase III subunit delta n=1 Tax=Aliidiomarina taiwanensis TaxID=946228 RepID=A0A432X991_9GAMM|nr:DNA polymerase III subunit delta [Aliidiomarina taiwanensis]RUO43886.1 DNA polymerase III subunit delta [Aliidiomarina taiwanensis]